VFSVGQNEKYEEKDVAERMRDHALFVAFAPADDPQLAVAVVVENGRSGSGTAAPIARKVLDAYLLPPQEQQQAEAAAETTPPPAENEE
jgi:penicillin-binding protein 2